MGEAAGTSAVTGDGDQVDTGAVADGDQEVGYSGTSAAHVAFLSAAAGAGEDSCLDIL